MASHRASRLELARLGSTHARSGAGEGRAADRQKASRRPFSSDWTWNQNGRCGSGFVCSILTALSS